MPVYRNLLVVQFLHLPDFVCNSPFKTFAPLQGKP
jgi:hypothetical protein